MRYFQKLYNKEFSKEVGLLEIRAKSSLINEFLSGLIDGVNVGKILVSEKSLVIADLDVLGSIKGDDKSLKRAIEVSEYDFKALPRRIIYTLDIAELGLKVAVVETNEAVMVGIRKKQYTYIATIVFLMLLLSYLYYWLAISFTRRIEAGQTYEKKRFP
ncbi:hypothetical protein [Cohnella herbarum]|uniref:Uncharacterized protein n=1 Tax=Cohnella herbarum TaxID=2728023 RepID=A0A7Z2ZP92_9BACL|nr:hypothetical protein [Cohnella herbarum]QJD87113.1 hypothetical protein HH215_30685 [Cohnella herbarum]